MPFTIAFVLVHLHTCSDFETTLDFEFESEAAVLDSSLPISDSESIILDSTTAEKVPLRYSMVHHLIEVELSHYILTCLWVQEGHLKTCL